MVLMMNGARVLGATGFVPVFRGLLKGIVSP